MKQQLTAIAMAGALMGTYQRLNKNFILGCHSKRFTITDS
jgi:hypothetical protein